MSIKVTFILKNDEYDIFEDVSKDAPNIALDTLTEWAIKKYARLSMKVGNGSFRDRVELNQLMRQGVVPTFSVSKRRGYRLATFEFVN